MRRILGLREKGILPGFNTKNRGKNSIKKLLFLKKFLAFLAVFSLIFNILLTARAEAGVLSFFSRIILGNDKEKEAGNILTAELLSAPINNDPIAGRGGVEINILGDSALLPVTGPLGNIADAEEAISQSGKISVYTVRSGDNISEIADMFSVSVNTILWANNMTRKDLLKAGQTLIILPISGVQYTVKKGDTAASIAKEFKGNAEEIISFNGLDGFSLKVGDTIIIPDGETSFSQPESSSKNNKIAGDQKRHSGYYLRPISGGRKTQGLHGYNGVDLAASCGSPIFASASGDVLISRSSGWNGGYGKYVVIQHNNGTQTLYAHNDSNEVAIGWHVAQGQLIGYVGSSGRSTGCHIHFEVRGAANPF